MVELATTLMDQEIEDTNLSSSNQSMDMMSSSIEGLVLTQLQKKQNRLGVIMSFMSDYDLVVPGVDSFLRDFEIKL